MCQAVAASRVKSVESEGAGDNIIDTLVQAPQLQSVCCPGCWRSSTSRRHCAGADGTWVNSRVTRGTPCIWQLLSLYDVYVCTHASTYMFVRTHIYTQTSKTTYALGFDAPRLNLHLK